MAAKNTKNAGRKKQSGSRLNLQLTPGRTLSLGAFALLAIVWAFILGVFVGRGYNPEDVIPDIVRIMPKDEQPSPADRILRPEELEFFDRLRSAPPSPVQDRPLPVEEPPASEQESMDTAALTEAHPEADPEIFTYIYQVGSFQNMEGADRLQQNLSNAGFSASITRAFAGNEPWYRVLVEIDSPSSEIEKIKKDLEEMGITQPLLRSRRPS